MKIPRWLKYPAEMAVAIAQTVVYAAAIFWSLVIVCTGALIVIITALHLSVIVLQWLGMVPN